MIHSPNFFHGGRHLGKYARDTLPGFHVISRNFARNFRGSCWPNGHLRGISRNFARNVMAERTPCPGLSRLHCCLNFPPRPSVSEIDGAATHPPPPQVCWDSQVCGVGVKVGSALCKIPQLSELQKSDDEECKSGTLWNPYLLTLGAGQVMSSLFCRTVRLGVLI